MYLKGLAPRICPRRKPVVCHRCPSERKLQSRLPKASGEVKLSIATVETAIRAVKKRIPEWQEVGLSVWREDQARYGIIDPIINALGYG